MSHILLNFIYLLPRGLSQNVKFKVPLKTVRFILTCAEYHYEDATHFRYRYYCNLMYLIVPKVEHTLSCSTSTGGVVAATFILTKSESH